MAKTVTERFCPTRRLPGTMTEDVAIRQGWEWVTDGKGKKWFCPPCAARRRGAAKPGACRCKPANFE